MNAASLRRRLPNSPLLPALFMLLYAAFFAAIYARNYDWNWSAFVRAGAPTSNRAELGPGFYFWPDRGHDGQFYFRLAHNPFTTQLNAYGVRLDNPAYRHQRIVYPTLAWIASLGGQPRLIPFAMVGLNVLGLGCLAWLGGLWARKLGRHAVWGVLLALHPGFLFTLWLDLTEIWQMTLAVAGLWMVAQKRPTLAAILLAASLATKETALLFAVAAALLWAWEQKAKIPLEQRQVAPVVFLVPIGVYIGLQCILYVVWGRWGARSGSNNLDMPFMGIMEVLVRALLSLPTPNAGWGWTILCQVVGLLALIFLACRRMVRLESLRYLGTAFVLYLILFLSLSIAVFSVDNNFMRAASELFVVGTLFVLAQSTVRLRATMLSLLICFWFYRAHTLVPFF